MRKISDEPVCFVVSLGEVKKYGFCPFDQLKKNPEAKLLFPKKAEEGVHPLVFLDFVRPFCYSISYRTHPSLQCYPGC